MVYLSLTSFSSRQKTGLGVATLAIIALANGIVALMPMQTLLVNAGSRTNPAMYLEVWPVMFTLIVAVVLLTRRKADDVWIAIITWNLLVYGLGFLGNLIFRIAL